MYYDMSYRLLKPSVLRCSTLVAYWFLYRILISNKFTVYLYLQISTTFRSFLAGTEYTANSTWSWLNCTFCDRCGKISMTHIIHKQQLKIFKNNNLESISQIQYGHFPLYTIHCMYSTFQQRYILKSGKLIFHIYSRYYFSFDQCNYTLSPTTPVFVESTVYNC